ncbi:MAG: M23 family metallopeptidase [Tannerella sp.]|jgi:hypothetical protein|nr:M23 family metallopeptidase [Tannerella sp.]
MFRKFIYWTLFWGIGYFSIQAQTFHSPFEFPLYLSGNFGELRPNHFHSGIDFKTQGVEGKPVSAVRKGYVCRIVVSAWGYGNVVYLAHPDDGLKTVYAHLQRFTKEMAAYVKTKQYEQESFAVDLSFSPEQFPIDAGSLVGYGGNSGSSGGPHLHFEVRDLETDEPVDPLPFYKTKIKDTRSPQVRAIMAYPMEREGVVNNSSQKQNIQLTTTKEGKQSVSAKIEAWGKIAFSINVDDFMDGTKNVYGVNELTMLVDNEEFFHSYLDRFSLNDTRYINAWVDYEIWQNKRSFYTKIFVEPGNKLQFIKSKNRGYIDIQEERPYHVIFELKDVYGNTNRISLNVQGKEQIIPSFNTDSTSFFQWYTENRFGTKGMRLLIPRNSLYNDLYFRHDAEANTTYLSDIHILHDVPVPLHQKAQLSLYLSQDSLVNKSQYGIISIRNKRISWVGGTYRDGWIDGRISELGIGYAIATDTVPPKINPIENNKWVEKKTISFKITDNLSGVESYRGEIDGQYVLFEMDGKKSLIRYAFDAERLPRGEHFLSLTVTDACGNESVYNSSFTW